ncbi:MAG: prephenate dehydrogenase/arogenate dehydrogenase family protein [Clostridiales bacterium]|nr:prephenate dehydrogenase/arogenate dehydrogenase family protein [Clostridiales bacterium]
MTETCNNENRPVIGVVGLGLIGASLCMALRGKYRVAGCSRRRETEAYALQKGMIDEIVAVRDMRGAVDCVVVCSPLWTLCDTVREVYDAVGDSAIITDVGSVKGVLQGLPGRIVGGHPMAGNEHSGIRAAKRNLFAGATYCVVPYENSREEDIRFVERLARDAGANPLLLSAREHDRLAASFSHLPHMAAYALAEAALRENDGAVAGGGFYDSTRIAASDPAFWTEVFRCNRENVLRAADGYLHELTALRDLLAREEYGALQERLAQAQSKRKALLRNGRKETV